MNRNQGRAEGGTACHLQYNVFSSSAVSERGEGCHCHKHSSEKKESDIKIPLLSVLSQSKYLPEDSHNEKGEQFMSIIERICSFIWCQIKFKVPL